MSSNDPLTVIHKCDHADKKVRTQVEKGLNEQHGKDKAAGNCVQKPEGFRLASKSERRELIAKAKDSARTGKELKEILPLLNAQYTFGHWWVKE